MTAEEFLKECRVDTFTAGDRTDIKVMHVPTGLSETESTYGSRYKARERCLERLMQRVPVKASGDQ